MKKLIVILALTALPGLMMAQDKDAVRNNQIEKCKSEFKQKLSDIQITDAEITDFCTCNADKLLSKFTAEEIEKMDTIMATGSTAQKQAVSEKITPVVMPCFADLQKRLQK